MGRVWGGFVLLCLLAGAVISTTAQAREIHGAQRIWMQLPESLDRAHSALKKGELGIALKLNREAEALDLPPHLYINVVFNYCTVYLMMGAHDEALSHCDQFVSLKPNAWEGWHNRGTLFLMMGHWDKAEADFLKGLKLKPNNEALQFNLGLVERYRHLPPKPADPSS